LLSSIIFGIRLFIFRQLHFSTVIPSRPLLAVEGPERDVRMTRDFVRGNKSHARRASYSQTNQAAIQKLRTPPYLSIGIFRKARSKQIPKQM
jgi:hypothetical protein